MSDHSLVRETSGPGNFTGANAGDVSRLTRTVLTIKQMDCPTEEGLIRSKLSDMPGVEDLEFNLVRRRLTITHEPEALAGAIAAIRSVGLSAVCEPDDAGRMEEESESGVGRRTWVLLGIAAAAALAAEILHLVQSDWQWVIIALSLFAVGMGGLKTYWKGVIALWNRQLNINALMSVAVTGAMAIGEWPEAAMVMVLFALAELIESLSLDRARHAIEKLMALTPEMATVRSEDGLWTESPAKEVSVGAIVRVDPGERIPLDGLVTEGYSAVDQAPITGESLPVEKDPGAQVFAGTINGSGSFEYRVTKNADDSTLARIIHAVEEAQGSRAPTQRFVDKFARIYTPGVFGVAFLVGLIPPLAFGGTFSEWFYRALVLLVIACPCALVISTPVTLISGLTTAARHGILIKGGAYLEQGRRLRAVALDKTGTVTQGRPVVTDFLPRLDGAEKDGGDPGGAPTGRPAGDPQRILGYAAALATRSDHPLSEAIAAFTGEKQVAPLELAKFAALPGRGIEGWLNGDRLYLGSHRLIEDLGVCRPELEEQIQGLEAQGKSAILLADERSVLAVFGVADTVRETSRAAIADLHSLGVHVAMLSGDNQPTASAIAAQVGIDEAQGDLLPEEKLTVLADLEKRYNWVGMAGDGINDAPALASANIGFAMGAAGSDTALETADVALMDDDLCKLPGFIRLSKRTVAILTQNIVLALGIKAVFLTLAVMGEATLWMAILADMGASLLVIFNGLRLARSRRPLTRMQAGAGPEPTVGGPLSEY